MCPHLFLVLLIVLAASGHAQQNPRAFNKAKGAEDAIGHASFKFTVGEYEYNISPKGHGRRIGHGKSILPFRISVEKDCFLTQSLYFAEYDGDLLLIGETTDDESGSGFIVRLDGQTLKIKWQEMICSFNIGQGLIDGRYAYVTGTGTIGKINLTSGGYVWAHNDLYRNESPAFNSFELPQIDGNTVLFLECSDYMRSMIASVRVDRRNGKIISLVK